MFSLNSSKGPLKLVIEIHSSKCVVVMGTESRHDFVQIGHYITLVKVLYQADFWHVHYGYK